MDEICCSVGVLTYNSGKNLRRTLESVKDFSNIIIADGGSTDDTLAIAEEYGCVVIDQYTKHHKGPDPYHPIADFARERNLFLNVATEDWFLWLDSDEYISTELHEEIRLVTLNKTPEFFAYEIPIGTQSPDAKITYRPWKQNYQIRFFNLKTDGRFERPMHERFMFDVSKYPVGRMTGVWYVPLSKPDFKSYSRAVRYRINVMVRSGPPINFFRFLKFAFLVPVKGSLGVVYRLVMVKILFKQGTSFPVFYFRNQLYSNWIMCKVVTKLYFSRSKD